MRFGVVKGSDVQSVEELKKKLEDTIAELNRTRSAKCWICNKVVHNWGVIFPEVPDGLGLGATDRTDGVEGKKTRMAFFPFCAEHDLDSEEVVGVVKKKLDSLRQELSN